MPDSSLIVSMTYPEGSHSDPSLGPLASYGPASQKLQDLALGTGLYGSDTTVLTDAGGDQVLARDVLSQLREMVANAKPGDNLFLGLLGHGVQVKEKPGTENAHEVDGMHETLALSDRGLIDDELHDLIAQLPEGVNLTVVTDACNSGTILDLDRGDIEANVLSISASVDGAYAYSKSDGSGSYFMNQLEKVMTDHPEMTWNEAAEYISDKISGGNVTQTVQVSASHPELLDRPLFDMTCSTEAEKDGKEDQDRADETEDHGQGEEDQPDATATLGLLGTLASFTASTETSDQFAADIQHDFEALVGGH